MFSGQDPAITVMHWPGGWIYLKTGSPSRIRHREGKGEGGGIIPRAELSAADEFRKGKSWPSVVYPLPTPLDSSYSMVTRMVALDTLNELLNTIKSMDVGEGLVGMKEEPR